MDRPPVWVMRQAGRYLPEYQRIRRSAGDFLTMCRTPGPGGRGHPAAGSALRPRRGDRLLRHPHPARAARRRARLHAGAAHRQPDPRGSTDIDRLRPPRPWTGTEFLGETLERVRAALDPAVALIGFCGAPWTLASYLVEGTTSRSFTRTKAFALNHPEALRPAPRAARRRHGRLPAATRSRHGAQAVQVFDSWVGILGAEDARRVGARAGAAAARSSSTTSACRGSTSPTGAPTCSPTCATCRARWSASTGGPTSAVPRASCPGTPSRATSTPAC